MSLQKKMCHFQNTAEELARQQKKIESMSTTGQNLTQKHI